MASRSAPDCRHALHKGSHLYELSAITICIYMAGAQRSALITMKLLKPSSSEGFGPSLSKWLKKQEGRLAGRLSASVEDWNMYGRALPSWMTLWLATSKLALAVWGRTPIANIPTWCVPPRCITRGTKRFFPPRSAIPAMYLAGLVMLRPSSCQPRAPSFSVRRRCTFVRQ